MELLELSANALKALGMKLGVFHVEAKYTSRGARLIEVNSRMGGGPVRSIWCRRLLLHKNIILFLNNFSVPFRSDFSFPI